MPPTLRTAGDRFPFSTPLTYEPQAGCDRNGGRGGIGIYLWATALALILLAPFRSRPGVFLPGLALYLGLLAGYVLVAPWGCSVSFSSDPATGEEETSQVVCTSPVGIEYAGEEPFEPSRMPALITGVATGVIAAAVTALAVRSMTGRAAADSS